MINTQQINTLMRLLNFLGAAGILSLLIVAFAIQLWLYELPCPLCLLQRFGLLCMAFGYILNLHYGSHPSHYALVLVSGFYVCFVALKQIALHVVPGTGVYGSAILGWHLYTWCFVIAAVGILITSIMLGFSSQYKKTATAETPVWKNLTAGIFMVFLGILIINIVGIFLM